MPKIYYDKVRLGFGQSLMLGNKPNTLPLEKVGNEEITKKLDVEKFGLFETATPNFHTYYPEVTPEDLNLKDSDFINPVFRALSEVVVHKKFNPIDFSKNGVLKAAMNKLVGQTVYANHEAIVGNEIGSVASVSWQKAYKTENGIEVPAGINAQFKIDAKSHPNIARAIMMDPPSIHSNSVTVQFAWEQSHPELSLDEFWGKLGTYAKDGEMIRRIVTEVANFHETSLVAHGADPFAQVMKDGKINNPDYANNVYSLSAQGLEKPKSYYYSFKEDTTSLSESIPNITNNKNENEMKDLILKLSAKYNKTEAEITESFIMDLITKGDEAAQSVTTLTGELSGEKQKLADATTKLTEVEGKLADATTKLTAAEGKLTAALTAKQNEAVRLYKVLHGDKADAAKLELLAKADEALLEVELKELSAGVDEKFPATCQDCHSTNVTRNSAQTEDTSGKEGGKPANQAQLHEKIRQENKTGYIFKSQE